MESALPKAKTTSAEWGVASLVIGLAGVLSLPLSWGFSSFFGPLGLVLALPGLVTRNHGLWIAFVGLFRNVGLTLVFTSFVGLGPGPQP
jgi:hypothetical protein